MNYALTINEHERVLGAMREDVRGPFWRLLAACKASLSNGSKILFFGNGGSAAQAQHLAAELMVRFKRSRGPIPAIALTTDTSVLTATANDYGYSDIFSRQVRALCRPGDVAIGLTTSGTSANVLWAIAEAKEARATTVLLCGQNRKVPSDLVTMTDIMLAVPSENTARVQEMHLLLGHMLCEALEESWQG